MRSSRITVGRNPISLFCFPLPSLLITIPHRRATLGLVTEPRPESAEAEETLANFKATQIQAFTSKLSPLLWLAAVFSLTAAVSSHAFWCLEDAGRALLMLAAAR